MDPFDDDRPELTGSLITVEFGKGGRILQLWASDPQLPDEGEDFQFVLPPIDFGEENSDEYLPGTILVGARYNPDEPWVLSKNSSARQPETEEFDPFSSASSVTFEYELPLLEDLRATGRFYEVGAAYPQLVWEVELRNIGRVSIEVGEVGFPLALNNMYDGFGWTDEQLKRLWNSRLHIHKFIGGAASWVFAQRMTATNPGLLVFPGEGTSWEFFNHVPASLNTVHQWEGIPVVYAHSRATIEREQWRHWMNEHTSFILEPGDSKTFQMRFIPCESDKQDGVAHTLAACGRPAVRLLPGAVAPMDVGIALEVSGVVPSRFHLSRDAYKEEDFDDEGSFCFIRPNEPGALRVTFEDDAGLECHVHLMFTEPISRLIQKRADYITRHQVETSPESPLYGAVLLTDIADGRRVNDPAEYAASSGIECSLADVLFLAEKNTAYPVRAQIQAVDRYIKEFLLDEVQNPGDHSVGSVLTPEGGIGAYVGRPLTYPHVFNLYHSMYRVASAYGETAWPARTYLHHAAETVIAMGEYGWRHYVRTVGVLGFARVYEMLEDLRREGMLANADELERFVRFKAEELVKQEYPFAGESVMDTSGFEEVFNAAKFLANDEHLERTARCAFAARSLAPSWWWYGSDKRSWDGADSTPLHAMVDRGEACLGHTTIPNSLIFFQMLDRDYLALSEAYMRMAFGGMVGPWSLVRSDGAASMCYCSDLSSKHAGYNRYTGASGLGYFHYVREVGAYVLPNRSQEYYTFGCHFEVDGNAYVLQPWDGVGRKIVMRQIGAEFRLSFGQFELLRLDQRKRWFEAEVHNPGDKDVETTLTVKGLWGSAVRVNGVESMAQRGVATLRLRLPARSTQLWRGQVVDPLAGL